MKKYIEAAKKAPGRGYGTRKAWHTRCDNRGIFRNTQGILSEAGSFR